MSLKRVIIINYLDIILPIIVSNQITFDIYGEVSGSIISLLEPILWA